MPVPRMTIRIQGMRQARVKAGRYGPASDDMATSILEDLAKETVAIAQKNAPKDIGTGAKDIYATPVDLSSGPIKSIGIVSPHRYMTVQEYGRGARRKAPSTNHVRAWGQRHGFNTKGAIFLLARSIGRKGFRGKLFMKKAHEHASKRVGQVLAKHASAFIGKF